MPVKANIARAIAIDRQTLPEAVEVALKESLIIPNPAREDAEREQTWGWEDIPAELVLFAENDDFLYVPRGFAGDLKRGLKSFGLEIEYEDDTIVQPVDLDWGEPDELRNGQLEAAEKLVEYKQGIIEATPGWGKTVMGLFAIKLACQKSLIIVDRKEYAEQWRNRAKTHFNADLGLVGGGVWEEKDVTIAMQQTLWARRDDLKDEGWFSKWGLVCLDECLNKSSQIQTPDGTVNICDIKVGDEVLAYDEEKRVANWKKVKRTFKNKRRNRDMVTISTCSRKLHMTVNHKLWTDKGWIEAGSVKKGDIIKSWDAVDTKLTTCNVCHFRDADYRKVSAHKRISHSSWKSYFQDPGNHSKAMQTRSKNMEYREYLSERMKLNNPSHDPIVRAQIEKSWKENWDNKTPEEKAKFIKNYASAPRYRRSSNPNKPEQALIDMKIPGITYTGDFKLVIDIGERNKNPDFIVNNRQRVIEVYNEYWHPADDRERISEAYSSIGYECLWVSDDEIYNDPNLYDKLVSFVENHDEVITRVTKSGKGMLPEFVYNIEVEDFHNYFANGMLVSNCHHASANTYMKILNQFGSRYRWGLSATPDREDGLVRITQVTIGDVLFKPGKAELRRQGQLVKPGVIRVPTKFNFAYKPTQRIGGRLIRNNYTKMINHMMQDRERHFLVAQNCLPGRTHLVVSDRLALLDGIAEQIRVLSESPGHPLQWKNSDIIFLTGRQGKEARIRAVKRAEEGNCIVFSTIAKEALDIPILDTLHLAYPMRKHPMLTQVIGRIERGHPDKNSPVVFDYFDPKVSVLRGQSRDRAKFYQKEGFEIESVF